MNAESSTSTVRVIADALERRKWLAVAVFLCVCAGGLTAVNSLPDIYYSEATVLIEHQRIPQQLVQSTVTSSLETRFETISQEILSRPRLAELIQRYDLYSSIRDTVPLDRLVNLMRHEVFLDIRTNEASRQKKTGAPQTTVAFAISYRGEDPEKVAAVTNTLASFYIEENLKVREEQAKGTSMFLSEKLEEMRKGLEEQERRLALFKERHLGELPHQQDANLATLEQLNTQLQQNSESQTQVSSRRDALLKQVAEARGDMNEGPAATMVKLSAKKQELAELRTRYSDRYPDVIRLQQEIGVLEEKLSVENSAPSSEPVQAHVEGPYVKKLNEALTKENDQLNVLAAEAERLRESIDMHRQRVERAPQVEQQYQLLARDYDTTKELYRDLLERQKEAELAESMEQRQKGEVFRLLEPAGAAERPAAPDRGFLSGVVLVAALVAALGMVYVREVIDSSFHSVDDLRRYTDAPLLAAIPTVVTVADRHKRWKRLALGVSVLVLVLVAIVAGAHFYADGNSAITVMLLAS